MRGLVPGARRAAWLGHAMLARATPRESVPISEQGERVLDSPPPHHLESPSRKRRALLVCGPTLQAQQGERMSETAAVLALVRRGLITSRSEQTCGPVSSW